MRHWLASAFFCGISLGYEDLNDHEELRRHPALALLSGKVEAKRPDCEPLAGKSTLQRLEHGHLGEPDRYHKVAYDGFLLAEVFVDVFMAAQAGVPERLTVDLDATDDPLHGHQEGRFVHGYYDCYCYLPLYMFCGRHLLAARLRRADMDASAGSVEEVARIVARLRERWPEVEIVLRADSGFAREELMAWCEANGVDYVFGLARNKRLLAAIEDALAAAQAASVASGEAARRFEDFRYRTLKSWSCERRVIGKAEHLPRGSNPRFIVTSLASEAIGGQALYEEVYCARGEMENRIKECQLDLLADRTSAATMRANQLRLWFASFAYVLLDAVRRLGLKHTSLANATCGSIRLKLLKLGARVTVSVRRIKLSMASGHPYQREFIQAHHYLARAGP